MNSPFARPAAGSLKYINNSKQTAGEGDVLSISNRFQQFFPMMF